MYSKASPFEVPSEDNSFLPIPQARAALRARVDKKQVPGAHCIEQPLEPEDRGQQKTQARPSEASSSHRQRFSIPAHLEERELC